MVHAFKRFLAEAVLPAVLTVGVAYNFALAANGPDGRAAGAIVRAQAEVARAELAEAEARTARLSARADGLMLASLDHDLLDERLRARLGLARPGERMVRMRDLDRLAGIAPEADTRLAALADEAR